MDLFFFGAFGIMILSLQKQAGMDLFDKYQSSKSKFCLQVSRVSNIGSRQQQQSQQAAVDHCSLSIAALVDMATATEKG